MFCFDFEDKLLTIISNLLSKHWVEKGNNTEISDTATKKLVQTKGYKNL